MDKRLRTIENVKVGHRVKFHSAYFAFGGKAMFRAVVWMIGAAVLLSLLYTAAPQSQALQSSQERKAIQLDPRVYDAYVGQYELAPNFVITITREANGLSLQATDQPKFEIFAESETKFFL